MKNIDYFTLREVAGINLAKGYKLIDLVKENICMNQKLFVLVLICLLQIVAFAKDFKFVAMGDSRGNSGMGVNSEILSKLCVNIEKDKPDFIIFTGDTIAGSKEEAYRRLEYEEWKGIMGKLQIPYYTVIGNHEMFKILKIDMGRGVGRKVNAVSLYKEYFPFPANVKAHSKALSYYFLFKKCLFVILDCESDGEEQIIDLSWVEKVLEENKNASFIFTAGHRPAYPIGSHIGSSLDVHPEERDKFWKLLEQYKVTTYFCGHEHLYDRKKIGSVFQIITGAAGAEFYTDKDDPSKLVYHYVLVEVSDSKAILQTKDINGKVIDRWEIVKK